LICKRGAWGGTKFLEKGRCRNDGVAVDLTERFENLNKGEASYTLKKKERKKGPIKNLGMAAKKNEQKAKKPNNWGDVRQKKKT